MLVDFEPVVGDFGKREELWEKVETGVFYTILNGEKLFFPGTNPYPEFDDYRNNYGVCDNADQIKRHYPEVMESDRKFVICMVPIFKHHQPPRDGWRWEKWGEYIGDLVPQCGYLYDEPEIEVVFVFTIIEVV
jgi:hypothetical protein